MVLKGIQYLNHSFELRILGLSKKILKQIGDTKRRFRMNGWGLLDCRTVMLSYDFIKTLFHVNFDFSYTFTLNDKLEEVFFI